MTLPLATVALDPCVTVPTVRPAPVIAVVATDCVSPTTFGTLIWVAEPLDPPPHAVTATATNASSTHLTGCSLVLVIFPLVLMMLTLLPPWFGGTRGGRPHRSTRAPNSGGLIADAPLLGQFTRNKFHLNSELIGEQLI